MMRKPVGRPRWRHPAAGPLVSVVVVCAGALEVATAQAASTSSLTLQPRGAIGTTVTGAGQFDVGGDTTVNISVAKLSGGNLKVVSGPDSARPRAVQFPSYVGSGTYPRAVLRMNPDSGYALAPGSSDFQYGAVFRLDARSAGRSIDNGNNLLQRGLYSSPAQFKLQVDGGYPSCSVRGSAGRAYVRSGLKIAADRWYRAACTRVGSRVTVSVRPYGGATTVSRSVTHSSGSLSFKSSMPTSIGGKLTASGAVVSSATDQFNGAFANAWVRRLN